MKGRKPLAGYLAHVGAEPQVDIISLKDLPWWTYWHGITVPGCKVIPEYLSSTGLLQWP